MDIKTLIFDLDGTLADCKELHQTAFRQAVDVVCPVAEYTDVEVEGLPTLKKISYIQSKGYVFDAVMVNKIKQEYTQQYLPDFVKYSADLEAEIQRLSKKYQLCVASNATQEFVYRSLDTMRITKYFVKINTATQYPAKPDPYTFVDCMTYCGSNSFNTVIFEDSPVGVQCAKKVITELNVIVVADAADTLRRIKEY